ncbi:MAG TPA: signal peptidase I [Candidatus Paceibacterota bacterium]|nr:signal peptidase I [Candidatus Paceibacterota bacterium]
MKQFFSSILEIIEITAVAFAAVFLIRTYLVQPFLVSGSSMVPNFSDGDYLLVDELTYHFRAPERGEVVVLKYPKNESVYFIKRIIGLPGERVVIKNNQITIFNQENKNGLVLDEKYLPANLGSFGDAEFDVPNDSYFVMGDNRPYSFDSRSWGMLPKTDIVGLVQFRLWPPASIKVFAAPSY